MKQQPREHNVVNLEKDSTPKGRLLEVDGLLKTLQAAIDQGHDKDGSLKSLHANLTGSRYSYAFPYVHQYSSNRELAEAMTHVKPTGDTEKNLVRDMEETRKALKNLHFSAQVIRPFDDKE